MRFFIKRIGTVACLAAMMLFTVQCEIIDEDLLNSPNSVSPENLDPDFLLNNIQIEARNIYAAAANIGMQNTRMLYMFGSLYNNAWSAQSFNGIYTNAYADLFIDAQNLLPVVENEDRALYFHAGMAKTLQAYAMITMVDLFGDLPFEEALDPNNFNPALSSDGGAGIYAAAIVLLDEAIADFQNTDRRAMPADDFFYGGLSTANKVDRWVRVANTIKLKAFLNTGNTAGINALITGGNLILTPAHDFTYNFGTVDVNPDSRHPLYRANYDDLAGAYMAISYLNMLGNDKADMDPRMRYYFYRQTTSNTTDSNENRCITEFPPTHFRANDPYCFPGGNLAGDGWWGRDHLIDEGIPPDRGLRTTYGVYPVGGKFDASQGTSVVKGDGLAGAGFEPILMSSFTWFMIAEAELTLNSDAAAARAALDEAIRLSFNTVRDFGASEAVPAFAITVANRDNYRAVVLDRWDNGTDQPGTDNLQQYRLRNIAKEYYLALWPNGYEAYNAMRRTGYPDREDNLQPALTSSPGNWYRVLLYPSNMVDRNSNASQRANAELLDGPFWDPTPGSTKFNF